MDAASAKTMLEWQIDLGATEAIGDAPINRYEIPEKAPKPAAAVPHAPVAQPLDIDPVAEAEVLAGRAATLSELEQALAQYEHCALKRGARNLVFADGTPAARIMVIGEAPGRDEDLQGKPFVGAAGQLLDKMFGAIGLARHAEDAAHALYITNILPWRPPQNRDPSPEESAMLLPFVKRHIDLVDPEILVLMGNISCQALLGRKGITRMRGTWETVAGRPALPMFHPAYLLRNPGAKREAWHDLLMVQSRLRET